PGDGRRPAEMGPEDLNAIKNNLMGLSRRRKTTSAGWLRVMVDGTERARLDRARERRVQLNLEGAAELVEVRAAHEGGDLLLASHLLSYDDRDGVRSSQASIVLEGGQKLSISVSPSKDISGAVINISYRETNPVRAASLIFHRGLESLTAGHLSPVGEQSGLKGRGRPRVLLLPALTVLFLAVCAAGIVQYVRTTGPQSEQPPSAVTERVQSPAGGQASAPGGEVAGTGAAATGETSPPQAPPMPQQNTARRAQAARAPNASERGGSPPQDQNLASQPAPAVQQVTAQEGVTSGEEVTRGLAGGAPAVSLLDVKRVHVELSGNDPFSRGVREVLVEKLRASRRFIPVENRDEADALLSVKITRARVRPPKGEGIESGDAALTLQLVNARGDVLWTGKNRISGGRHQGRTAEQVGAEVVRDLLDEIEKLQRRR
ncbi:MAG: hypothetical protein ACRD68_08330, partial [Pyrinomonadaceae bacterium]